MEIKINKKYRFLIEAGSRALTFTGLVTAIENNFITFIDKFDKELNYNLKSIISFEELEDGK